MLAQGLSNQFGMAGVVLNDQYDSHSGGGLIEGRRLTERTLTLMSEPMWTALSCLRESTNMRIASLQKGMVVSLPQQFTHHVAFQGNLR